MNTISFHDTHAYPGCTAIVSENAVREGTTAPAIVDFSDGATATAIFEKINPEEISIHVDAYTTARGTRIPQKTWRLRYNNAQDIWKVAGKM
ncbi:MAG: hypothetical protein JNL51_19075 [Chitinophagaceae bacterium]|nr:hypothetical protein [Chitinophagaceae bacterium]